MPIPSTTKWPQPNSEDEWENMVLDAMRVRWDDPNADRYGRRGQKQDGVDVLGKRGTLNVAAQAKNSNTISEDLIKSEIQKAEKFFLPLDEYYFVISGHRDTNLQRLIQQTSIEQKAKNSFKVFIIFFEDVCQHLAIDPLLIEKYWSSFFDAISRSFKSPILTEGSPILNLSKTPVLTDDDAISCIFELDEFKDLEEQINILSSGTITLNFRVEQSPNLQSAKSSMDRTWQIAIAENHETHIVTIWRIAINVDDGSIKFYYCPDDKWIDRNEWIKQGYV